MNENAYKTMNGAGAFSIAMGIVLLVVGIAVGVGNIITGAALLRRKSDITF